MLLKKKAYSWIHYGISIFALYAVCCLFGCKQKAQERSAERSFYYWKSVFKLTGSEKEKMDSLGINTIYIKFFDVDWNDARNRPVPKARIMVTDKSTLQKYRVIPTVFITNECIKKIDDTQTGKLAQQIHALIRDLMKINQIDSIPEVQIDCDWSASTREKYFSMLLHLKPLLKPGTTLSATIRLHQIKYRTQSGIPPVDKGLLMCYNMGNLKDPSTSNSILESSELKKYSSNIAVYSLPLDIGLPIFDWKVLFRNNNYVGLVNDLPDRYLSSSFGVWKGNRFLVNQDTLLNEYAFKKGDVLRSEQSTVDELFESANSIHKLLKNTQPVISLYHLDSVTLSKYKTNELEAIYDRFNQ